MLHLDQMCCKYYNTITSSHLTHNNIRSEQWLLFSPSHENDSTMDANDENMDNDPEWPLTLRLPQEQTKRPDTIDISLDAKKIPTLSAQCSVANWVSLQLEQNYCYVVESWWSRYFWHNTQPLYYLSPENEEGQGPDKRSKRHFLSVQNMLVYLLGKYNIYHVMILLNVFVKKVLISDRWWLLPSYFWYLCTSVNKNHGDNLCCLWNALKYQTHNKSNEPRITKMRSWSSNV